ncbi:NADPH-dependent pterin aldehyde reductase-like [Actinia tenebrosa]|uniref:NADPH-dependent pterin aldehyde reductase-like n=1 Tax=Actinia tenebrosa TaxID=6105 RepID=A0A6P8J0I9_ACTTE|nr:NADPH-dependent pterin aldehyde reductase-like [Actinia tenebrosa]
MSLSREVIVITGVSAGLGYQMLKWFSSKGHIVIGCARSAEKVQEFNSTYCEDGKPKQFFSVDITDDSAVKNWAKEAIASFGAPSYVLNNAGLNNKHVPFGQISKEEFDKVVDINIKGSANVIRHFLPDMMKAKRGVIVNFSSGFGRFAVPNETAYCATKWGIEGFSKALALELPSPMVCVPLDPGGMINTPMLQDTFGKGNASKQQSPEEWAQRACPFILSITRSSNGESVTVPS